MSRLFTWLLAAAGCAASSYAFPQSAPNTVRERAVLAAGPSGPLGGSLLQVENRSAPLALIVPGSGPTDRDGNSPAGLKSATYRLLAEELSARGISVARIDKRGMFGSSRAVADANAVTLHEYAADIKTWVHQLQRDTGVQCAWVIGHSEGGLVALLAGDRDAAICGAILLSVPGRPLGQILREQLQANPANGPILTAASPIIDALEAGRHVNASDIPPVLLPLFRPQVQDFLISALRVDPLQEIAGYRKPILIVQGERDLQVGVNDALLLARAAPNPTVVLVPQANHVLKAVPAGDRLANLTTYTNPSLPIVPEVVEAIITFVTKHSVK